MKLITKLFLVLFLFTLLSALFTDLSHAQMKLKIAVVNPSTTEKQTSPVRFDLPKGLDPKNILDIGDMELKYDSDKGNYYVYEMVELKPSERKTLEIRLEDIWIIPEKDTAFLKKHTEELDKKLAKTRHARSGKDLTTKIESVLSEIDRSQADATMSASKKINLYYENTKALNDIKEDIGKLENLVVDVGGIVEERVQVPKTLAVSVGKDAAAEGEPVVLTVKVSNPSRRKQVTNVKYDLPAEITPRDVIDSAGLDIAYNFNKQCFSVSKNNVALESDENKTYVVKLKDIWRIPNVDIESLRSHTANLMQLVKGTQFFERAKPLSDTIASNLDKIVKTQSEKVPVNDHIAYFRDNTELLGETRDLVAQLEKMVIQSGTSPGVTVTKAERVEGGGPEVKRKRGYEGVAFLAETIFKGKAPSPATTWKIIFIILGFIGVVSGLFFALWYIQAGKKE